MPNDNVLKEDTDRADLLHLLGTSAVQTVQGLRQSTAVIALLIANGILTQAEVDEQMRASEGLVDDLKGFVRRVRALESTP